jgi:hypothetical protein
MATAMLNMKKYLFCWIGFLLLPVWSRAQDSLALPKQQEVSVRSVSNAQWTEASKALDYSKDVEKKKKERTPDLNTGGSAIDWTSLSEGWGMFFQILAILLAVLGIAYGVYRMLQVPRNRALARDGVEITPDNVDAYIHETDLDRFLRQALADQNYPLAIRLYYLKIIKSLDEQQAIHWAREKTNRQYLREMQNHPKGQLFRTVTTLYEGVWYGNQTVNKDQFDRLQPIFIQMSGV